MKTMEFTLRVGCRNMCKYCPQLLIIKQYSKLKGDVIMSFETFKICLDKIPKDVRIDFSGMAEPWLNENATKMLLYAYRNGFKKISVFTTTVGMTKKDLEKIKKIPFTEFMVHLADGEGNTKIQVTKKYLKLLNKIKQAGIKNIAYMTMGEIHPLLKKSFGKLAEKKLMLSRAGNLKFLPKIFHHGPVMCNSPSGLKHNILLPNGDVYLCCMDYGLTHKLGNLLTDDYEVLFKEKEFTDIKQKLKNKRLGDIICRHCEYAVIDNYKKYLRPIKNYFRVLVKK